MKEGKLKKEEKENNNQEINLLKIIFQYKSKFKNWK